MSGVSYHAAGTLIAESRSGMEDKGERQEVKMDQVFNLQQEKQKELYSNPELVSKNRELDQVQIEHELRAHASDMHDERMQQYLEKKYGSSYADAEKLTEKQQSEVDETNMFKRSKKKREMQRSNWISKNKKEQMSWRVKNFQDRAEGVTDADSSEPQFLKNENSAENMPLIKNMRSHLDRVKGTLGDDAGRAEELLSNCEFWLSSMMTDGALLNSEEYTEELKEKEVLIESYQRNMQELAVMLNKNPGHTDNQKEAVSAMQQDIEKTTKEMSKMTKVLGKSMMSFQAAGMSWTELFKIAGLGKALRTDVQEELFRKREDAITVQNQQIECERMGIEYEKAQKLPTEMKIREMTRLLCRKHSQTDIQMNTMTNFLLKQSGVKDPGRAYVVAADPFHIDSEGNVLKSEEPIWSKGIEFVKNKYSGDPKLLEKSFPVTKNAQLKLADKLLNYKNYTYKNYLMQNMLDTVQIEHLGGETQQDIKDYKEQIKKMNRQELFKFLMMEDLLKTPNLWQTQLAGMYQLAVYKINEAKGHVTKEMLETIEKVDVGSDIVDTIRDAVGVDTVDAAIQKARDIVDGKRDAYHDDDKRHKEKPTDLEISKSKTDFIQERMKNYGVNY